MIDDFQYLCSLGNQYALSWSVNRAKLLEELAGLQDRWRPYNPRKNIPRFGLSLTSLEGGDSGVPDLDSLLEYNKINGTHFNELSFRTPTSAFQSLTSLFEVTKPVHKFLGRSHLIRFGRGGYFPPHRDSMEKSPGTFRLISLLQNCTRDGFIFLLDGRQLWLEPNRIYFVNTRLSHSLFSYAENATILVLNVEVCAGAVDVVTRNLEIV